MFEDNNNDLPEFEDGELKDDEFDLMYTSNLGIRIFNLNNQAGTSLLGIVLFENDDSFLVGLPSKLLKKDDKYKVELYMPVQSIRLMKSSVSIVSMPFTPFEEHYLEFLDTEGRDLYPEVVCQVLGDDPELDSSSGPDIILDEYEFPSISLEGLPLDPETVIEEAPTQLDEIDARIQEIAAKGGLILNGSKTKQ